MSELSVRQYLHNDGSGLTWGYDKSEVDKLIVSLEESHKKEVGQLLMEILELKKERDWLAKDRAQAYDDLEKRAQLNIKQEESNRHHKYKRCLAMAKWCRLEQERIELMKDEIYRDFIQLVKFQKTPLRKREFCAVLAQIQGVNMYAEIKFCPMCGRKLTEKA